MEDHKAALSIAENKKRIFDQMASMHFRLSDKYNCFACIADAIEIIISVSLCGITFLDFQTFFNTSLEKPMLVVGLISILSFAFNLIKQSLGHKQLSEKHQMAGKMYARAKLDITSKIAEWNAVLIPDEVILGYIDSHYSSLNDLPQIPEKQFARLKHWHQSKVEMSKFLDSHKNDYWLVCKLKFRFTRNKGNK